MPPEAARPTLLARYGGDLFWLRGIDVGLRAGPCIRSVLPEPTRTTSRALRRRHRYAAHIAASYRLRRAIDGLVMDTHALAGDNGAVFTTDGRMAHAEGDAANGDHRERLREAIATIDKVRARRGRRDAADDLDLWPALVEGRWSLVDTFESDGRRFIVARHNTSEPQDPRALSPDARRVAALLARGLANKEIGYELGLSPSRVAGIVADVMRSLGASTRLEVIARREGADAMSDERDAYTLQLGDETLMVVSTPATVPIPMSLSPSEGEVLRLLLMGLSNLEIAERRGTSVKTVANQVSAIFRRLRVGSRHELLARLLDGIDGDAAS